MSYWWLNRDFFVLCAALLVLVAVPLWIWWLSRRYDKSLTPRRIVISHRCEICGDSNSPVAFLEFDGYEPNSFWRLNRVEYAAAVCSACADQIVAEARQRSRTGWLRCLPGSVGWLLTRLNSAKALRDRPPQDVSRLGRHPLTEPENRS